MKKVVLFGLLFAAVAVSAQAAHVEPLPNTYYKCWYVNPTMGESNPGFSRFTWNYMDTTEQKRGIEYYDVTGYTENRKVTFAKPADGGTIYNPNTTWEFTINPSGPQCKKAKVSYSGSQIDFSECTDGHSRFCTIYW